MAETLNELKKKYKVHEETDSYFRLRTDNGKPYYEITVDEARLQKEEVGKQFGGETEFEGTVKDFTVPSPYIKGKLSQICILLPCELRSLIVPSNNIRSMKYRRQCGTLEGACGSSL